MESAAIPPIALIGRPESTGGPDPFDLAERSAYAAWRAAKLAGYPRRAADLVVALEDPLSPSRAERAAILTRCEKANMAIYVTGRTLTKEGVLALGCGFGLRHLDRPLCTDEGGVTEIRSGGAGAQAAYIPYSNRPLSWHSDGYYNRPGAEVRGVILHCARAAQEGGELTLLDPEIAYIRLRDANPDFIAALSRPGVLTIPANQAGGEVIRAAKTGPVFSVIEGRLHMRYTARKRYALWRDDPTTNAARAFLTALLDGDEALVIRHRLAPGEGLICNNVLHKRAGYADPPGSAAGRLVCRARFLDRVGEASGNVR